MPQAGQEATSTEKPITECPKNMSEAGYKCVCLNARRIVNKKNGLNIMVEDIESPRGFSACKPHRFSNFTKI